MGQSPLPEWTPERISGVKVEVSPDKWVTSPLAHTAGSPRSSSSRPGSTDNSYSSHNRWLNFWGPVTGQGARGSTQELREATDRPRSARRPKACKLGLSSR